MQIALGHFDSDGFDQRHNLRQFKLSFVIMHADFRARSVSPNMSVCDADICFNQLLQLLKPPDFIRLARDYCIQVELAGAANIFGGLHSDISQTLLPLFFVMMMIVVVMIVIAAGAVFVMFMATIMMIFGMAVMFVIVVIVMIVVTARPMFVMFMPTILMLFGMIMMIVIAFVSLVVEFVGVVVMMIVIAFVIVFVVIVFAAGMMNVF